MVTWRENEELTVITKTYDLILLSCHHTGKFPCNHRFVLGERLERNLWNTRQAVRQPATKFAHPQKKMQKQKPPKRAGKKK